MQLLLLLQPACAKASADKPETRNSKRETQNPPALKLVPPLKLQRHADGGQARNPKPSPTPFAMILPG